MTGSAVIGALRVNLGIDSAAFSNGLKQAQSGLAKFGALAKSGMLAAAAGASAAAGAMAMAVKGSIDAADDMSKAASKIGVPIEELSRLKYAADLSGVSFEGLQTAVGKLSKQMNEAKNGSKSAVDAFSAIGVSATNADGTLKSASAVLTELSDRFASMPDGAEKTALAMELMGRSGANMIPLLNGGSAALQGLMSEADQFGQVFTAEMGANAEAFNDNISRLQGAFGAVAAKIAQELLPYLRQFSDWLVQNAPTIGEWSGNLAASFQLVVNEVIRFRDEAVQFGQQIQAIVQWFTNLDAGIRQFGQSVRNVASEIATAFAELPAKMMEIGGQIIDGLWNGIKARWDSVKAGVTGIADSITTSIKSTLGIHSPSRVMQEVGTHIVEGLANGMAGAQPLAVNAAGSVSSAVTGAFEGVDQIGSSISSSLSSAFQGLIDGSKNVKDVVADLLGSLSQMWMDKAFQALLGGGAGGGGGGMGGGIFGALLGGLFGFANGGSFKVGGAGGVDSQLVAFKASPNETVSVTRPDQERHGGNVHVTFGVSADNNGNLLPFVESVAQSNDMKMAPRILSQANSQVMPTVAGYQRDRAGGDYRNG